MKRCPQCNRVETDDALAFCRADGTALISDSGAFTGDAGTAKFGSAPISSEIETSILPHRTDADMSRPATPTTVLPPTQTPATTRDLSKPKRRGFLLIMIALVLVVIAVAGYFYSRRNDNAAIGSIAVLPFVNQNNDPNMDYLSDGITESIISSLAQLPNLKVMARTTVFRYKGQSTDPQRVGKELGVGAVLTGKVFQRGDALVIRADLVRAADGSELWGEQYSRSVADVFAVQEEIAKEISEKLRLKLTSTEQKQLAKRPTENLKAFQYYMQGRAYAERRSREDLLMAIQYDEKALQEDPNYALAYAGLADAYDNLGVRTHISPPEGRRKAEEAARKALALDDRLAEAHAVLGEVNTDFVPYNFSLADRELREAIELSPSLAMAHQYLGFSFIRQGRLDEALSEMVKARGLDPLSPIIARQEALPHYLKRDYVRAMKLLRQADELGPPFNSTFEIGIYIQNGLLNEALAELENVKRERKGDPLLIFDTGMVYAAQGKRAEALQVSKELEEISGPALSQALWIAKIHAALNDKDIAVEWLERGLAAGVIGAFFKDEPVWDPLRSDPRFAELLQRMGVPS